MFAGLSVPHVRIGADLPLPVIWPQPIHDSQGQRCSQVQENAIQPTEAAAWFPGRCARWNRDARDVQATHREALRSRIMLPLPIFPG